MTRTVGAFVTLTICLLAQAASGAEIKVYSTIGVKSPLEELGSKFEKATASSSNSETGKALVKFLTSPEAQAVFTAHGFDPP